LTESRLNHIQVKRGSADAADFDHFNERTQLPKFHGSF